MSENKPRIRKICTFLEETFADGTVRLDTPTRKAAAAAVFANPFAGEYQEDLSLLIQWSEELGAILTQKAVGVLGWRTFRPQGEVAQRAVTLGDDLPHKVAQDVASCDCGRNRLQIRRGPGRVLGDVEYTHCVAHCAASQRECPPENSHARGR